MRIRLYKILLQVSIVAVLLFGYQSVAKAQCNWISGPFVSDRTVVRGQSIDLWGNLKNCSDSQQRMYYRFVLLPDCTGREVVIFTSSSNIYNAGESKATYTHWKVPSGYVISIFKFEEKLCSGQASVILRLYQKNFWGTSHLVSQSVVRVTVR